MQKLKQLPNCLLITLNFIVHGAGRQAGIGAFQRCKLALKIFRSWFSLRGSSATSYPEQLTLVNGILSINPSIAGDIAEFGCYKGVASCALSNAAKLVNRKLLIFDSFEGLPTPTQTVHNIAGEVVAYRKGDYAGTIDEVKSNVSNYGAPEQVIYVKGFYSDSLPSRVNDIYVMIFEDADLVESVRDVLNHAWPRLIKGGYYFCHEARDLEVVEMFYDRKYWQDRHKSNLPGLVGAGVGLPLDYNRIFDREIKGVAGSKGSCLGFTKKEQAL